MHHMAGTGEIRMNEARSVAPRLMPEANARRSGRRLASLFATAAMGSWVVLAAMPVVVVILALS